MICSRSDFCKYIGTAERPPMKIGLWVGCVCEGSCSFFLHSGFCRVTHVCDFRGTLWPLPPLPFHISCARLEPRCCLGLVQHVFIPGAMIGTTKCVLVVLIEGRLSHPTYWLHIEWMVNRMTLASAWKSAPLVGILIGIKLTL